MIIKTFDSFHDPSWKALELIKNTQLFSVRRITTSFSKKSKSFFFIQFERK